MRAFVVFIGLLSFLGCASAPESSVHAPRETFRAGTGPTIVMLGGGVYGAAMFAPHARELAHDFDVVRVQTLNVQTAESGEWMPADYSVAGEAAALRETLERIAVSSPVDLVGSSFGAVVALRFAAEYPERVRKLVLFEPPLFSVFSAKEIDDDETLREMRTLTTAMKPAVVPTDEQLVRFRCLLGACPPSVPRRDDPARSEWDRNRRAMRGLSATFAHREDLNRLSRLPHRVLLVNGRNTVEFHRRINERLASIVPHVETAELPGGHGATRTAITEFSQLVRTFLKRE